MKRTLRTILIMALSVAILLASVSMVFGLNLSPHVSNCDELIDVCSRLKAKDEVDIYFDDRIIVTDTIEIDVPCKLYFHGADIWTPAIQVFYLNNDNIEMYFNGGHIVGGPDEKGYEYAGDGEAFYISGSHCVIDNVEVNGCGSKSYGSAFVDAFHSDNGGAIYINGWDNTITNCKFNHCTAQDDGGAICIYYDKQLIQDCTFTSCEALDDAGAIYCCSGVDEVVINRCTFNGCTSGNEYGKIVYGRGDTIVAGCENALRTEEYFYDCQFLDEYTASILSTGNIIIIIVVIIAAAAVVFFVLKKKKPAAQN